jgi:photosystem II stability/assembly factor-like uncharacterized protein
MKTKSLSLKKFSVLIIMLAGMVNSNLSFAQTWTQINSGTTKKINTICFTSSTVGYIGGNDSLLMKTTNGGATWNNINYTGITFYPNGEHILNLQFLNNDVGFMTVGPYSGSYGTIDGGLTWSQINLPGNQCFNKGMYFFDENNGFIGGSGCFQGEIISNVNNANWLTGTWNASVLNGPLNISNNYITDIDFYDSNFGMAVSQSGYVFRTINGGVNWDSIATPAPLFPLTSVLIMNDTLAYAGYEATGTGFGLYISTDAGLTWSFDMSSATFYYPNFLTLHETGNGTIYTGGNSQSGPGVIFNYSGVNSFWNIGTVDQNINDIASYNDSIVFAVGDSGYIVVNHPQAITGKHQLALINNDFTLFPNPTENLLSFSDIDKSLAASATISLYSSIGILLKSETFSNSIDVSSLSQGIYFLELKSNGQSIKKKFVKK